MITITKKKIVAPLSVFEDFFKAVDTCIDAKDIVYLSYNSGKLSFFSEDKFDGISSGVSVSMQYTVDPSYESFSVGIDAERSIALFKRLYDGDITIKLNKNKLEVREGNIKASFAIVAKTKRYSLPEFVKISGDSKNWIVAGLSDCLASIVETGRKGQSSGNKFYGILFDTSGSTSRICKFSNISLFLKSGSAVMSDDYRVVLPDGLAKACRTFKNNVRSILISKNVAGVELENNTIISMPMPHDYYPLDYISHLSLGSEGALVSKENRYEFEGSVFSDSMDLISTSLGKTDSWVTLEVKGKAQDRLVWTLGGKSHKGMEVSEDITSSMGPVIDGVMINKERAIKALMLFKDKVYVHDLSPSVLALSDEAGMRVALLVKARI